jgi:hypothetical protein
MRTGGLIRRGIFLLYTLGTLLGLAYFIVVGLLRL